MDENNPTAEAWTYFDEIIVRETRRRLWSTRTLQERAQVRKCTLLDCFRHKGPAPGLTFIKKLCLALGKSDLEAEVVWRKLKGYPTGFARPIDCNASDIDFP